MFDTGFFFLFLKLRSSCNIARRLGWISNFHRVIASDRENTQKWRRVVPPEILEIVEVDSMPNMTPFLLLGACVAFRCQKSGNNNRAMIPWHGHACSRQPTKAQMCDALKHGWRVFAMSGAQHGART